MDDFYAPLSRPVDASAALAMILNSVPPSREFRNGMSNDYVINEACHVNATLTGTRWVVNSVTIY